MPLNIEGKWWLPEEAQNLPWLGTLREDADGYALRISVDSADPRFGGLRSYSLIYGRGLGGELFTLVGCFDRNSTTGGSGIIQKDIVVNMIYRGSLLPREQEQRLFRRAVVSFPQLKAWLGQSGFHTKSLKRTRGWDLQYRRLRPIGIRTSEELRIDIRWRAFPAYPAHFEEEAPIREWVYVTFSPAKPRNLAFFDSCISTLRDLLALATRRVYGPVGLSLTGTWYDLKKTTGRKRRPASMSLLRQDVYPSTRERRLHPLLDMTFTAADMPGGLESCLQRWFDLTPALVPARNLFAAATADRGFLEQRFLTTVQAIETFHRRTSLGKYTLRQRLEGQGQRYGAALAARGGSRDCSLHFRQKPRDSREVKWLSGPDCGRQGVFPELLWPSGGAREARQNYSGGPEGPAAFRTPRPGAARG